TFTAAMLPETPSATLTPSSITETVPAPTAYKMPLRNGAGVDRSLRSDDIRLKTNDCAGVRLRAPVGREQTARGSRSPGATRRATDEAGEARGAVAVLAGGTQRGSREGEDG
ncbi:MAG: hypothetical protein ACQEUA_14230, partial [Halobacteriota archaeon]